MRISDWSSDVCSSDLLLLVGLPKMHSVPDVPTRDDAEQALAELGDLLREMQFVGAADKAVALSLIVSAVVRGALAHIPLHLIKAPSIGSGKSFLVDLAARKSTRLTSSH